MLVPVGADDLRLPQASLLLIGGPGLLFIMLACALLRGQVCAQASNLRNPKGFWLQQGVLSMIIWYAIT